MKALQKFTPEYIKLCAGMKPEQIARFLEEFRMVHGHRGASAVRGQSKLISMKITHSLLLAFRGKCQLLGVPYQTQIKRLMTGWLRGETPE